MQRGSRQLHRNCQSARECRLDLRSQFRPFRQRKSSIFIGKKNDEKMMDKHRLGCYFLQSVQMKKFVKTCMLFFRERPASPAVPSIQSLEKPAQTIL
jgi:hypothetical protein